MRSRFETQRLILRPWLEKDFDDFSRLNADPKVTELLTGPLTLEESTQMMERIGAHFTRHGFGLYAAELKETEQLIGFIGLAVPGFAAHFTPCVEISYRLFPQFWNQGLATEGAKKILEFGFIDLELPEIVSFTVPQNHASRRVMEKLGMSRKPQEDFEHPLLPNGHPLQRHVLYRLSREVWQKLRGH